MQVERKFDPNESFWSPEPITAYKVQARHRYWSRNRFDAIALTGWFPYANPAGYKLGVQYDAECAETLCLGMDTDHPIPHVVPRKDFHTTDDFGSMLLRATSSNLLGSDYYGSCGFYAFKNVEDAYDRFHFDFEDKFLKIIPVVALLEVQLEGRILECEFGYRASKQTIVRKISVRKTRKAMQCHI